MNINVAPPTYDYFEDKDLGNHADLEELVDQMVDDFKNGYFLAWEAVIHQELRLTLTAKHKEALSEIISFNEDDKNRVVYIDDRPWPSHPWHEIVKKVVPRLLVDQYITSEPSFTVITEGWPNIVYALEEYGKDLTLPEDENIQDPIDIVPAELQHKLWIQSCLDDFSGIGQEDELTLENKEMHYIEEFIESLEECIDSVYFLDLTLQEILKKLILPPKEKPLFIKMMIRELGLSSTRDRIADFL